MARTKKPTKTMQINVLHEKLDEYGQAVYWLSKYMEHYGIVKHYQAWVEAGANETDPPPPLIAEIKAKEDEG